MKRYTSSTNSKGVKPAPRKRLAFLFGGLVIMLAAVMSSGCSLAGKASNEPVTPEPPELNYSISISAAPIQISSGNLHWHRELPNESYTLENVTLEIYNLGDFDIAVAQLEIMVDEDTQLFNIDRVIAGEDRQSLTLQPMMEGYDGGVHCVYMSLLDANGGVLYRNQGEDIGPLEPEPGTGSWHSMPS
jgi:hypothetical protein